MQLNEDRTAGAKVDHFREPGKSTTILKMVAPFGSPYERGCYLGVPLESQTTGPQITNWSLQVVEIGIPSKIMVVRKPTYKTWWLDLWGKILPVHCEFLRSFSGRKASIHSTIKKTCVKLLRFFWILKDLMFRKKNINKFSFQIGAGHFCILSQKFPGFFKWIPKFPRCSGNAKWPNWRGRFDHRWGYCHHPPRRVIRKAATQSRVNDHHKPKLKSCMNQEVCVCVCLYMKIKNIMICNATSMYI